MQSRQQIAESWGWMSWRQAALLLPVIVISGVFLLAPLLENLVRSLGLPGESGLAHYRSFFTKPQYLAALSNTLAFSLAAAVLALVIALPACTFVAHRGGRWLRSFIGVLIVAMAISGLIRTVSWQIVLGNGGLLDAILMATGVIRQPLGLLYTPWAVLLGMVQIILPAVALALINGLGKVDRGLIAAARSLGASPFQVLMTAYLPQIRPTLMLAVFLGFSLGTGLFLTPTLLGGPDDVVLGKVMLGDMVFDFENGAALGATSGVVMTAVVGAAGLVCLALGGRGFRPPRRRGAAA